MFILQLVLVQIVIFTVLIIILRKMLQGQITSASDRLDQASLETQKKKEELMKKVEEAEALYQEKTAKTNQEVAFLRNQAKEESAKMVEESRKQALSEKEKIINQAVETRDAMKKEVMAEMEEKAIQHSKSLIAGLFTGDLRDLVHQHLVNEVLQGLAEFRAEQFQIQNDVAEILSAQSLTSEQKKQLEQILIQKVKKQLHFKELVQEDLVAGFVIRIGTFVIDGSLANRIREAASRMKKDSIREYQKTK